ncbi:MAG: response regulator transcription factor, partial [Phormidium sp.]
LLPSCPLFFVLFRPTFAITLIQPIITLPSKHPYFYDSLHTMCLKILIVDDEPNIRILLEQALEDLEDEGVELLMASHGLEALEVVQEEHPNLIFLDVMMPKKNGLEVCKTIKQDWNQTDIYIVMLTAKGQEVEKEEGFAMGADFYMTKPFRPKEIVAKARSVLDL